MSDSTPNPPTPEQPTPPSVPDAGAVPPPASAVPPTPSQPAPGYAPAYTPAVPVKQTLSLVSFIIAIVAFVLSWVWGIGFIPGIVAVILGFLGKSREPQAPKWMWMVGIIGGFVAIGIGLIFGIIGIIGLIYLFSVGAAVSTY